MSDMLNGVYGYLKRNFGLISDDETKTGATEGGIETSNSTDATATDGGKYSGVALDSVHGSESESGCEVDLGSGMDLDDGDDGVDDDNGDDDDDDDISKIFDESDDVSSKIFHDDGESQAISSCGNQSQGLLSLTLTSICMPEHIINPVMNAFFKYNGSFLTSHHKSPVDIVESVYNHISTKKGGYQTSKIHSNNWLSNACKFIKGTSTIKDSIKFFTVKIWHMGCGYIWGDTNNDAVELDDYLRQEFFKSVTPLSKQQEIMVYILKIKVFPWECPMEWLEY